MSNKPSILSQFILAGAVGIAAPAIHAQPKFMGMGPPPVGTAGGTVTSAVIAAIADSGEVFGQGDGPAFAWSHIAGYTYLPGLKDPEHFASVYAASTDGSVLAGGVWLGPNQSTPAIWYSREDPPVPLDGYTTKSWSLSSFGFSASANCDAVMAYVTLGGQHWVYRWTASGGGSYIKTFPPGVLFARPNDLDDTGTIGYGSAPNSSISAAQGVRWAVAGGFELLGDSPGGEFHSALETCDALGLIAAGYSSPGGEPGIVASLWMPEQGWIPIGRLRPDHNQSAFAVMDASGMVCVGKSVKAVPGTFTEAILWNPLDSMRSLKEILDVDYGLAEVKDWDISRNKYLISPNGRYIAGTGVNPQGAFETWWAEIVPFCYADCDRSTGKGTLDVFDFLCYMSHFDQEDIYSNCNNDGAVDFFDFLCFINKWQEGCP